MDETLNYVNEVRKLLLTHKKPSYQTTNKKEVRVRCPYCGDSSKDPKAAHLYIAMQPPFKFHCFKCEKSGVLNQHSLRDFGLIDNDLAMSVIEANKVLKDSGVYKIKSVKKSLNYTPWEYTDLTPITTGYFNSRYNTNLESGEIIKKFKAVLDPMRFIQNNNIFVPPGQYNLQQAIGFVSADASHIIFRDISGMQRRYYNLNINQDDPDTNKMYNISGDIDIMSDEITLVMTEGIFDIIGVYLHFYRGTEAEKNTIFAAACGKGFNAVIAHYVRMGFLNLKIVIYSDADVQPSFYRNLKNNSVFLRQSPITVYYNDLYDPSTGFGKDYGVPKEQIKLRKVLI
jgi:hypothetical protein